MIGTTGWPGSSEATKPVEINGALAGQIAGKAWYRLRLARFKIGAGITGEAAQQGAQILAAAFAEKSQQRVEFVRRQRRSRREPRVIAVFTRQHRKRDVAFARQRRQPLDAVFPPIEAAEQAHNDHLGVRADAIDP